MPRGRRPRSLGRREKREAALAELLQAWPGFCCRLARERLFYLKDESQIEHYVDGLWNRRPST